MSKSYKLKGFWMYLHCRKGHANCSGPHSGCTDLSEDMKTKLLTAAVQLWLALVGLSACEEPDTEMVTGMGADGAVTPDGGSDASMMRPGDFATSITMSGETCLTAIDISAGGMFTGSTATAPNQYQTCNV